MTNTERVCLQRKLVDRLTVATAVLHAVARRRGVTVGDADAIAAMHNWREARDALRHTPRGTIVWRAYCDMYQWDYKVGAIEFFVPVSHTRH